MQPRERLPEPRGSVVNYPGNPRFRPRAAVKVANTTSEMDQKRWMLEDHALVISDVGPMSIQLRDEVKDVILHQFRIRSVNFMFTGLR
jgi:hypothetical protein